MHCEHFLEAIDLYLEDTMDHEARQAFRSHLAQCANCREQALLAEPTLMFAAMPPREVDELRVERCVAGVQALMGQDRLERRLRPRFRGWMAAAALLVAGFAGGMLLRWNGAGEGAPGVAPGLTTVADREADQVEPPSVEVEMAGDGVRVYQYAQDEDDNTAVYFIVNSSLES